MTPARIGRFSTVALLMAAVMALCTITAGCVKNTSGDNVPNAVHQAAALSLDFAQTLDQVQSAAIQANQQKILSDASTVQIVSLTVKLAQQGKVLNVVLKGQATLTPAVKGQATAALNQMLVDIQSVVNSDVSPISNQNVKAVINAGLGTAQTVIRTLITQISKGGN